MRGLLRYEDVTWNASSLTGLIEQGDLAKIVACGKQYIEIPLVSSADAVGLTPENISNIEDTLKRLNSEDTKRMVNCVTKEVPALGPILNNVSVDE